MSARNSRTAKAARRAERTAGPASAPWNGTISRARIAETVQYAVTRDGQERYAAVPEELCLAFASVAGMMASLATGGRYALQIGGRAVHDTNSRLIWSYGLGRDIGDSEFHTWASLVPTGTSPEALWSNPPQAVIVDLTTGNDSATANAVKDSGHEPLPPWWWDTRAAMRERHGVTYRARRGATLQRLASALAPADDADDFGGWTDYLAKISAHMLGLPVTGWTVLAPGSYLIGHPAA